MTDEEAKTLQTLAAELAAENGRLREMIQRQQAALRSNLAVLSAAEQRCEPLRRLLDEGREFEMTKFQ